MNLKRWRAVIVASEDGRSAWPSLAVDPDAEMVRLPEVLSRLTDPDTVDAVCRSGKFPSHFDNAARRRDVTKKLEDAARHLAK